MVERTSRVGWLLLAVAAVVASQTAFAADAQDCTHFTWNVAHELAVMQQTPQMLAAGTKPDAQAPRVELDRLYELRLSAQGAVTYALAPARATVADDARGGVVRSRVARAGLYRISLGGRHWVDVVDGGQFIKSRDFQGSHDCERPHKIVEFELPAARDLLLQFSGSGEESLLVAITAVSTPDVH
jgi:hypothetical protein